MPDVKPDQDSLEPKVICQACLKEVPASAAHSVEGRDYTFYFCGLDCYHEWRRKAEREGVGGEPDRRE